MSSVLALSASPTCAVPIIVGTPVAGVLGGSSSDSLMAVLPNDSPPSAPATVMSRSPSAVSLPSAATVTETESCPAASVTWWPSSFASPSAGVTV